MTGISHQAFQILSRRLELLIARVDTREMSMVSQGDMVILSIPSLNTTLHIDSQGMNHVIGEKHSFHPWSELLDVTPLRPSTRDLFDGSQRMGNPMRKTTLSFLDSGTTWQKIVLPCGVVSDLWHFVTYDLRKS